MTCVSKLSTSPHTSLGRERTGRHYGPRRQCWVRIREGSLIDPRGMGRRQIAAPLARAPTPFQGKSDQQKDSNGADDIRHPGERTGHVACVRPDEADRRPSDNENDHRGQPVDKSRVVIASIVVSSGQTWRLGCPRPRSYGASPRTQPRRSRLFSCLHLTCVNLSTG
jgi:hypothetical protein